MSISKLHEWIDKFDPYALQRMILYKMLVLSVQLVFVYWIFKPSNYVAFLVPLGLVAMYEMPVLSSFRRKEQAIVFIFAIMLTCSITFYLIFPFRIFFLFYSLLFFSIIYFLVLKRLNPLKNATMVILLSSIFMVNLSPSGDLQVAYAIFSSSMLSMATMFFSLRTFTGCYFTNWSLAQQKFIQCLEKDIGLAIAGSQHTFFSIEDKHITIVHSYQGLLQKKYLLPAYRFTYHIRNIQFALSNNFDKEKHELFWQEISQHLHILRNHMRQRTRYHYSSPSFSEGSSLHQFILTSLTRAINQWNKLCTKP